MSNEFANLENAVHQQEASEKATTAIAAARVKLILGRDAKSAFFSTLALRLEGKVDWNVPTMYTNGYVLGFNPDFVLKQKQDELLGIICHEVLHCVFGHPAAMRNRDAKRWNIACDLAVNSILREGQIALPKEGTFAGEGEYKDMPVGKSAEEYYKLLGEKEPPPPQGQPQAGNGQGPPPPPGKGKPQSGKGPPQPGQGQPQPGFGEIQTAPDGKAQKEEWEVATAQAEQASKGRGELPAGLNRVCDQVVRPAEDWRAILQNFVCVHAKNDYSWTRPNRRYLAQNIYLPGMHSLELGEIVVAIDTSGSIGNKELGLFTNEFKAILGAYNAKAKIIYHDTVVCKEEEWSTDEGDPTLIPKGGGGTSHKDVYKWVEKNAPDAAALICFTDLYTEFPAHQGHVPTLWAVVGTERKAPFGIVCPIGDR